MPLPISSRQLATLRQLRRTHPTLATLAINVAHAFDSAKVDNPEIACVILEVTCRRIVSGDPMACEALLRHLGHFSYLDCFSSERLREFENQVACLMLSRNQTLAWKERNGPVVTAQQ